MINARLVGKIAGPPPSPKLAREKRDWHEKTRLEQHSLPDEG